MENTKVFKLLNPTSELELPLGSTGNLLGFGLKDRYHKASVYTPLWGLSHCIRQLEYYEETLDAPVSQNKNPTLP